MPNFFLSYSQEGKQVFSTEEGVCSSLLKDAKVYTHHSAVFSKFTMDPNQVVEVSRLPVETILSDPALSRITFNEGDNAIRAQLGYLDGDEAPEEPEVAMIIAFKEGKINAHSYIVGGRAMSVKVPLKKLEGCCKDIDPNQTVMLGVDFASVQFAQGRKASEWKRIEVKFKDCMSGPIDFSKLFIYSRWRILESAPVGDNAQGAVSLHLEVLPLNEDFSKQKAELNQKYNSSSNVAISLLSIPLRWRKPDERRKLFTTPCLVMNDSKSVVSDGIVRFSMATVRDFLRRGRSSVGSEEHKATISSPQVLAPWRRSPREVFMPESDSYDVIGKGKHSYSKFYSNKSVLV